MNKRDIYEGICMIVCLHYLQDNDLNQCFYKYYKLIDGFFKKSVVFYLEYTL